MRAFKDALCAHARHARDDALLFGAVLAVALLQFFAAPLLLPRGTWTACAIVALCAAVTPLHWGLMHEAIHGHLFAKESPNRHAGRLLGHFLCLSFDVMRFGHLLHHSHNRHEFDRPEAVGPDSSRFVAAIPYYLKLLGGHALISAVLSAVLALPSVFARRLVPDAEPMRTSAGRAFGRKERRWRIRGDLCAIAALLALAMLCWRGAWPVFAATIVARFLMLSLLDNAPHYGTALDSGTYARNTRLPRWAEWIVMGHNFHGIHHGSTGLRWQELRAAFVRAGTNYEGGWPAMVLRQFRGPVYLD